MRLLTILFCSFICTSALYEEAFTSVENPYTIESAVQTTLERNPTLQYYRERLTEDHEAYSLAIGKIFPAINFQGTSNYLKNPASDVGTVFGGEAYNQYDVNFNVNQPLWDGGALLAGYQYAKKDIISRQTDLDASERDTTNSVLQAFYGVVLNEHLLQILQDNYNLQKEILNISERYYKIGRAEKIDVLQQRTATALLPPQIAQADDNLKTAASQLATLLRDLGTDGVRVQGRMVTPTLNWVKQTHDAKKTQIPQLVKSRLTIDELDDTRDITMATYNPKLSFLGSIGRQSYTKTDLLDQNNTSWTIGLELDIPIFAGLSSIYQNKVYASQHNQLERQDVALNDTQAALEITSEKNLQVAKVQLDTGKIAAVYGQESLTEAEKQWRMHTITYLQYQTSEQAYLTAETNYYQAQYNYITAIANYFVATGTPMSYLVTELERLTEIEAH
jgi:outer membrane protein